MTFFIELTGYIAAIIMAISLMPQVYKSWKTKSTKDISIGWNSLYLLGMVFWIIYATGILSDPLLLAAILEASFALALSALKIKYG